MSSLTPYAIEDGLAVYRIGAGEPILLMPGPHRFERPGLRSADALIDGLVGLGRQVITFDPPGSGRSTRRARLSLAEMYQCTDEALRRGVPTGTVSRSDWTTPPGWRSCTHQCSSCAGATTRSIRQPAPRSWPPAFALRGCATTNAAGTTRSSRNQKRSGQ